MRAPGASLGALVIAAVTSCASGGPTVVVEHALEPTTLVRNVRFNGCVWPGTLKVGDATAPRECLSGPQRAYFEALDTAAGVTTWTGYQTTLEINGSAGDDTRIVLTPATREKDLTAPGPYGH